MTTDFSTIDRLVEFGLGISVAQQMVNTMNYTVGNMRIAGVENKFHESLIEYYAVIDGQQVGPFGEDELKTRLQSHSITKETLMWTKGMSAWKYAGELSLEWDFLADSCL